MVFSCSFRGKIVLNKLLLPLILFIESQLHCQIISYDKSLICLKNNDVKNFNCLLKNCNNELFMLRHDKKTKLNLVIHLSAESADTLLGVYGDLPWDFAVNAKMEIIYFLHGNYGVEYKLNNLDNINSFSIENGSSSTQIDVVKNKLIIVNFINDGRVDTPKLAIYNESTLSLERIVEFKSLNYNAFNAAISPFQNRQIEVKGNLIIFTDFISGAIDIYDLIGDTIFTISQFLHKDLELSKIKKMSAAYLKTHTYKQFNKLNTLSEGRKNRIIQFFIFGDSMYVLVLNGNLKAIDFVKVYATGLKKPNNLSLIATFKENAIFNEVLSSNNFILNELYTEKLISIKNTLIVIQKMNSCSDEGKSLEELFRYKSGNDRIFNINQYRFHVAEQPK